MVIKNYIKTSMLHAYLSHLVSISFTSVEHRSWSNELENKLEIIDSSEGKTDVTGIT